MIRIRRDRRRATPALPAASACLGAVLLLSGCGSADEPGYAAVGAGSPGERGGEVVAPSGDVRMVPLEDERPADAPESAAAAPSGSAGSPETPGGTDGPAGGPTGPPPSNTAEPSPLTPAELTWGEPRLADADDRWCEKVTLTFTNSGGAPVASGTVTFGTHIIGAVGVDWATVESTRELPVPIAGGAAVKKTWTLCVDAWRVPIGMHVDTQDVEVTWKGEPLPG